MEKLSKFFKIRHIGGKSVGFSLKKYFIDALGWSKGDTLRGYVENNKLIIELFKKSEK